MRSLRGAQQAEATLNFVFEQLEQPHHAGAAAAGERKALHAADADQIGAGRDRLDDIGRFVHDDDGGRVEKRILAVVQTAAQILHRDRARSESFERAKAAGMPPVVLKKFRLWCTTRGFPGRTS